MGSASSSSVTANPAFLTVDERVPLSVRELLAEADGCIANGFLTGGTACAVRAVEAILKLEKVDGPAFDARLRALAERYPSVPQLLVTILQQFGEAGTREMSRLAMNTLQLLVAAAKAVAYEIYVIGPERTERLQYVRRMLESIERKPAPASDAQPAAPVPAADTSLFKTPPTLGALSKTPVAASPSPAVARTNSDPAHSR